MPLVNLATLGCLLLYQTSCLIYSTGQLITTSVTDCVFKISRALLQCDFATSASSGKVCSLFRPLWIWEGLWLFSPTQYGRSDARRIARLRLKREYGFHLACWNTCMWSPELVKSLPMLRLSCCVEAKPHEEATCNLPIMPTQVTDMRVNKPADDSSPQLLSHPQTLSLPKMRS